MTRDEMQQLLKQKPFVPFRVFVSDRREYDVRHPRMTLLADTYILIGRPVPEVKPPSGSPLEQVRFDKIVRVEMLPQEMSLVES
jgi:hypothetical protein